MVSVLRPAAVLLALFTVLTGLVYPAVVTGAAQGLFPKEANGSILEKNGFGGSVLIGQPFDDPKYFWGRPSATAPFPTNASASTGSNQGPASDALREAVEARIKALREADPASSETAIPVDLVTASGSGLDPDISPAAAFYQARRVANARGLTEEQVKKLVAEHVRGRTFGVLGDPRVNVLELNIALDALAKG